MVAIVGCSHSAPVALPVAKRFGPAMIEIALRFERAGRAVLATRGELASYDVDEIAEIFDDDLVAMADTNAAQLARDFARSSIPAMRDAARKHDAAAFKLSVAQAARTCNACHRASGKAFIEIPDLLGVAVPMVGP